MGEFLDFSFEDFRYKLYIPGSYEPDSKYPLMVMLHGCDQNPDDFAAGTRMNTLAEKENLLVLYPDMNHLFNPSNPDGYNPYGCWNWFLDKNQHRGKGHPKLINGIIEEVKSEYHVDPDRIYAAGLSAGASLACILGVTYPDVFSGIGVCAGLAYDAANVVFFTDPMAEAAKKSMQQGVDDPYECGNSAFTEMGAYRKKMPIIVFHGICDTVVHPINGQQVIIQWAQTNFLVEGGSGRAKVTPLLTKSDTINGKTYTQHVYGDGSGEPLMELWMIDEMGHTWSGGSPNGSYTDPLGPNATEIIWDFFRKNHQESEITEGFLENTRNHLSEDNKENLLNANTPSDTLDDSIEGRLEHSSITTPPIEKSFEEPDETIRVETSVELAKVSNRTDDLTSINSEISDEMTFEHPKKTSKNNFIITLLMKLFKRKR